MVVSEPEIALMSAGAGAFAGIVSRWITLRSDLRILMDRSDELRARSAEISDRVEKLSERIDNLINGHSKS